MFRDNILPSVIDIRRKEARKWNLTPLPRAWTRPDRFSSPAVLFRHMSATTWKHGDPADSYPRWWNPEIKGINQVRYNNRAPGSSTRALETWLKAQGCVNGLQDSAVLYDRPFSRLATYRLPVEEWGAYVSDSDAFFEPGVFSPPCSIDSGGAVCVSTNIIECHIPAGSEPDDNEHQKKPQKLRKCSSLAAAQLIHAGIYIFDTPYGSLNSRELCMVGHLVDSLERESFPIVVVFDGKSVTEIPEKDIREAQVAWHAHDRFVWRHMFAAFKTLSRLGTFTDRKPDISSTFESGMVPSELHTEAWILYACSPAALQILIGLPEHKKGELINKYNRSYKDYARACIRNLHFIKRQPNNPHGVAFHWAGTGEYPAISGRFTDFCGARQSYRWPDAHSAENADGLHVLRNLDALCALGAVELRSETGWCLTEWGAELVRQIKILHDPDMLLRWRSGKMICTENNIAAADRWIKEQFTALHENISYNASIKQSIISADRFRAVEIPLDLRVVNERTVMVIRDYGDRKQSTLMHPSHWVSEHETQDGVISGQPDSMRAFLHGLVVRGVPGGVDSCIVHGLKIDTEMSDWAHYEWGKSDIPWNDLPKISDACQAEGTICNKNLSYDMQLSETGEAVEPTSVYNFIGHKSYRMKPVMFVCDMPEPAPLRLLDAIGRYMKASGNSPFVTWFDGTVMRDISQAEIDNACAEWAAHHRFMSSFHRNMKMIAERAYVHSLTKLNGTLIRRYPGLEDIKCVYTPPALQLLHLVNDETPLNGISGGHEGIWYQEDSRESELLIPGTSALNNETGMIYRTQKGSGVHEPLITGPLFMFNMINPKSPERETLMHLSNAGLVKFHKDMGWRTTPAGYAFLELLGPATRDADVLLRWRKPDGRIGGPENAAAMDRWLVSVFRAVKRHVQHLPAS